MLAFGTGKDGGIVPAGHFRPIQTLDVRIPFDLVLFLPTREVRYLERVKSQLQLKVNSRNPVKSQLQGFFPGRSRHSV